MCGGCSTKAKGRWEKEGVLQNPTSGQGMRQPQLGHQQWASSMRTTMPQGTWRGEALGPWHQRAGFPHKEKPNPEAQP